MKFDFELPEIGPKWFELIMCPVCKCFVMFKDDFEKSPLTCPNPECGEVFDFVPEKDEEFPEVQIEPCPNSLMNIHIAADGTQSHLGKDHKRIFVNVFNVWRNFMSKDKPVPLTDSLKIQIYEKAAFGLPAPIINKSIQLLNESRKQKKN